MAGRIQGILTQIGKLLDEPVIPKENVNRRFSNSTGKNVEPFYAPNYKDDIRTEQPVFPLSQLEGHGVLFPESDVTAHGATLVGIGNKPLARPVVLDTGVDHIFYDSDALWRSDKGVVNKFMNRAERLQRETGGKDVYLLPYSGFGQSSDFFSGIGRTMINYNLANAPASTVKQMDNIIKDRVPTWKGSAHRDADAAWNAIPAGTRMEITEKIDRDLRNQGSLSEGQARVATARQEQLGIDEHGQLRNVGLLDVNAGWRPNKRTDYNADMFGQGVGVLDAPGITAYDLLLDRVTGSGKPLAARSLQWQDTSKVITEKDLLAAEKALEARGIKIKSGLLPGIATAGVAGASLLGSEDADASVAKLAARGMELVDLIDPEDSRVGEYFLRKGDDTKSIGSLRTDYAIDSGFDDGYMSSLNTEIAPDYRRQGLAGEMYDAAEEISGNKLVPSTHLSMDGAHMWNARDSKLLREVHEKMEPDNYNEVEDILYPDGRPNPNAIKLRGFKDRVHGPAPVATAGLLGAGVLGSEDADAAPLTAFTDKGNKWLQKLLAEAEQADLPQSAIDQGYSPSILQHVGEPGLQGYDLNAAAAANENAVSGMYNYPTKRESDRYLDQMQRYRDKSLEQYETVTRGDKAFVIGGDTPTPEMEQQFLSELEDAFKVKYSELPEHKQGWFDEKVDQFLRYGDLTASPLSWDAKNRIYRAGGADVLVRNGREIVSLKPEQVRSPKAQFNIDDQGSNNFMASVAGAGVLGALALPQNSQAEEYTEAPVIDEQSFGSMVQEYGDINRRAKAADDQKFGLLMADRSDRAGMSRRDRRASPASPELQEFTKANALPSLLQFASGVGEGGVDYLKDTFSGGGYVTAPAYASQQYEDINKGLMMAPEEARAPLRADQIHLDPRMAEEAERLNAAGRAFAGILSMFSPI